LANFKNIPLRHRKPVVSKDYRKIYAELRSDMLDIIEQEGTIGQALLKIKLGWGDGTYNRRKAEIIELFSGFVNWNSHTKIFTWIKQGTIDKPLTEKTIEDSV